MKFQKLYEIAQTSKSNSLFEFHKFYAILTIDFLDVQPCTIVTARNLFRRRNERMSHQTSTRWLLELSQTKDRVNLSEIIRDLRS